MKFAEIFGNNMVLQRDEPIRIFGTGKGKIKIDFIADKYCFESTDDNWCFELKSYPAQGPVKMNATLNGKTVCFENIYIGDVYLAAGQSNMEFVLKNCSTPKENIHPNDRIRFFKVACDNQNTRNWFDGNDEQIMDFSAIGYHFADMLSRDIGIAIGVISCNRGASTIGTWIDKSKVENSEVYLPPEKRFEDVELYPPNGYGDLHDMLLKTFEPYNLKGVLWYQGESNRGKTDSPYYAKAFDLLVKTWREEFKNPNLPFITIGLASFGETRFNFEGFAAIRKQQLDASRNTKNVTLISITDLGEKNDIHPKNKYDVAKRAFWAAKNSIYGTDTEYTGPVAERFTYLPDEVVVEFSHADGMYFDGEPNQLLVSCDKTTFAKPQRVTIEGNKIHIFGDSIKAVSMANTNFAVVNLFNGSNLPAIPFVDYK